MQNLLVLKHSRSDLPVDEEAPVSERAAMRATSRGRTHSDEEASFEAPAHASKTSNNFGKLFSMRRGREQGFKDRNQQRNLRSHPSLRGSRSGGVKCDLESLDINLSELKLILVEVSLSDGQDEAES